MRQRRAEAGTELSFVSLDTSPGPAGPAGFGTLLRGAGCRGVTGPVPSASLDAERDVSRFRGRRYQTRVALRTRQRRALRQVLLGELPQQPVQLGALGRGERREQLLLEPVGRGAQLRKRLLAGRRET